VRVEEIDARTAPDETLAYFAEVEHACAPELAPGEPVRSTPEVVAFLRHQPRTHTSCHWSADGGVASLYVHGPSAAFANVLVLPDRRRQGIGAALLERVLTRGSSLGAVSVHASHATPAGAAFAARFGFVDGQRIVHSLLDLGVEPPEPRPPEGWSVVTWLRSVPDEHLEAFVRARGAIDDAPTPDELEFPPITAETVRASEESLVRRGREMRLTVAIRGDGEIGAFTELRVSPGSTLGFTDDTATVAAYRRHGLARAVKLESLRRLRADHPEITVVSTSNAEENAAMRGLNEQIGFRPTLVWTTATRPLAEAFVPSR
jgi:mycothiol synthase